MKTDSIEFTTQKSLQDIISVIRGFANKYHADIMNIEEDVFGEQKCDIEVALMGKPGILSGDALWGVQVYVVDQGDTRNVELVALGDSFGTQVTAGHSGYFVMPPSKKKRNQLAALMSPNDEYASDVEVASNLAEPFLMLSSGQMVTDSTGISLQGKICQGSIQNGDVVEILNLETEEVFPTRVNQIRENDTVISSVGADNQNISILTDFMFVLFSEGSKLIIYKQGEREEAINAYHALMGAPASTAAPRSEEEVPVKLCPICNSANPVSALFCSSCGSSFDDAVKSAGAAGSVSEQRGNDRQWENDREDRPAASKPGNNTKQEQKQKNKFLIPVIVGAAVLLAAVIAFAVLGNHGDGEEGKSGSSGAGHSSSAPLTTVFFASDYGEQAGWDRPSTTLSGILEAAREDGKTPDEVIMLGDYNSVEGKNNYDIDPEESIEEIRDTVQEQCPDVTSSDFVFVQGNTDKWSSSLSGSGLHEFGDYLVYVLNTENDFPWSEGKNPDSLGKIKKSSARMEECFDELIEQGETRPVIIASHMPLHFTARTSTKTKTGDNLYSSILFDVINRAGNSLHIIYLYGHNCAKGWDCYLGGSSVYRAVGDTLLIPDFTEGAVNTDNYYEETLNFTYLNGGYIGYYMNCSQDDLENGLRDEYEAADESLTGTVCEIYPDKIVLTRYDTEGVHPLGWQGEADPYDGYIDKDLISNDYYSDGVESPQTIDRK